MTVIVHFTDGTARVVPNASPAETYGERFLAYESAGQTLIFPYYNVQFIEEKS